MTMSWWWLDGIYDNTCYTFSTWITWLVIWLIQFYGLEDFDHKDLCNIYYRKWLWLKQMKIYWPRNLSQWSSWIRRIIFDGWNFGTKKLKIDVENNIHSWTNAQLWLGINYLGLGQWRLACSESMSVVLLWPVEVY